MLCICMIAPPTSLKVGIEKIAWGLHEVVAEKAELFSFLMTLLAPRSIHLWALEKQIGKTHEFRMPGQVGTVFNRLVN